jgi:uncharacterized protein involved in oxidation of intracellular sulfur
MLSILVKRNARICACGTCLDARGMNQEMLIEGVEKSTMNQLVEWTKESDKVINY